MSRRVRAEPQEAHFGALAALERDIRTSNFVLHLPHWYS